MPSRSPDVLERAVDGQSRRGQHRGAHAIEQQLPDDRRDVDRRRAQEDSLAAELDEVHIGRIARSQEEPQLVAAARAPAGRPTHPSLSASAPRSVRPWPPREAERSNVASIASSAPVRSAAAWLAAAASDVAWRARALRRARVLRCPMRERELAEERSRVIAQPLDGPGHLVRVAPAGDGAGSGEALDVPGQIFQPVVADRESEVLRRDILELMRLVDNRVRAGWNDLAVRVLPDGGVGAEQMMVDDHHVRRRGALAHARDETVVVAGTFAAETGLRRRRHFVPERQILRQILELGAIAGVGPPGPFADHRQEHVARPAPPSCS